LALLDKLFGSHGHDGEALRRIGGYTLIETIARGPMSTVYIGHGRRNERVAVKVLTEHGNRIAEKLSVKLKKPWEGERAKILKHPNIVSTLKYGKSRGHYYIIMEYLPGGSFAVRLHARAPEIMGRRLEILLDAANALAYLHEKGIIHRDVCPKNLMFDSEGTVKLIDFGVAIHKTDRLRPTEVRTGRPSYLAPELIRHNIFTVQTDIYAFGVMIYEAFAGQRPFTANSRDELMNQHLRAEPVPPSRIDHAVSSEVDRVALRALAKEPDRRYATVRELITALIGLRRVVT
jgi:eukaryotic-like serine/threonine-protein kinase